MNNAKLKSNLVDTTLLTLLGFIVFYDSLNIYFLSDNVSHIENAYRNFLDLNFYYFRPVAVFSLAFDQFIWGMAPFGFHLTNLLIHLAATFLVYFFAGMMLEDRFFQWLSGLFFLLHPIHSIPVFWISGRTDMICALFYLLSLIFFVCHQRAGGRKWQIVTFVSFLLALLTKEMAASLPVVFFAWRMVFSDAPFKARLRQSLQTMLPYLLLLFTYFLFRFVFISAEIVSNKDHQFNGLLPLIKNFAAYIGLMIIPGGHIAIAQFLKANPAIFIALAITALIALLIAAHWIRKSKPLMFFVLFMIVTLLPVLRLLMRWYLYIPSIGFCLALAWLIWKIKTAPKPASAGNQEEAGPLPGIRSRTMLAIVLAGIVTALYLFFLVPEQQRWKAAGAAAKAFTGKLAETVIAHQPEKALMLNMDGELEEAQVLNYGLGKFLHFRLSKDYLYEDSVQITPVTFISWQHPGDRTQLIVARLDIDTYTLSLAKTGSFFVFPNHSAIYGKRNQVAPGTKISETHFDIVIDRVNDRQEAIGVTVHIKTPRLPVIYYRNNQMFFDKRNTNKTEEKQLDQTDS